MSDEQRELLQNITPFGLRMQPVLKERIAAEARANNRSMNAEIVARLEQSGQSESTKSQAAQMARVLQERETLQKQLDAALKRLDELETSEKYFKDVLRHLTRLEDSLRDRGVPF